MSDIIFTEVFIQVGDALSIRISGKGMPALQQFVAEFPVIVDLAIEDDGNRTVLVVDRLPPAVDVNDRQTSHAKPDLVVKEKPVIVWPSPANKRTHPPDQRLINLSWL
jgi:hypothetical protein